MKKNYKVINGDATYRLVSPEQAESLLEKGAKVYAIYDDGHVDRLQLSCDVRIFQDEGVKQFGIEVGEISEMLLNME